MQTFSSKEVISRLKKALSLSTDNSLAEYLGVSKATLSNWKSRNTIDFPLMFSKCEHLSMDWVIMGRGEMQIQKQMLNSDVEMDDANQVWIKKALEQAEEIGRLRERIRVLEEKEGNLSTSPDTLEGFLEEVISSQEGEAKAG